MKFRQGPCIADYAMIAIGDLFYILGGITELTASYEYTTSSTIATFSTTTREWKKVGELNKKRYGHLVLPLNGEIVVVGGGDTERCIFDENSMIECTEVQPYLRAVPEMMTLVSSDYCKK